MLQRTDCPGEEGEGSRGKVDGETGGGVGKRKGIRKQRRREIIMEEI